jgi:hypothetical protein
MDPYAEAFAGLLLVVGTGFLACIVVELAAGQGSKMARAVVGLFFAIADLVAYVAFINVLLVSSRGSPPDATPSGEGPVILVALAAWVVPVLRLVWLRRKRTA